MLSARTEKLINTILDGEASEQDIAELQALVGNDAELAGQLADRITEHRLLGLIHQPFDSAKCVESVMAAITREEQIVVDGILGKITDLKTQDAAGGNVSKYVERTESRVLASLPTTRNMLGLAAGVALTLVLVGAGWLYTHLSNGDRVETVADADTPANMPSTVPLATLLLEGECVWSPRGPIGEGKRLEAGRVELESGTAVFRFDCGAELVMVGPAVIELESSSSVSVVYGDVVVQATDGAEGFVVKTPTSEVVDLGTEFAIKVNRSGETEVHVLDGKVSYRKLDPKDEFAQILRAGEGVAIDQHGRQKAIPMNAPRFSDFVNRINPKSRADLLTAYEGFNYTPGILPLRQSTVGIGWEGPWRRRLPDERRNPLEDASPDELEIVHGQMNVTWPVPGGRLGMLKLSPGIVFYVRPLKKAIDLGSNDVTYFSLMVREIERRADREQPREHLRLTFRSSDDYFGDAVSFGHGPRYRPRVQVGAGSLFTSPFELPAEQTTLWIGKIVSRARGEDEVYFRIYGESDALGYAEPATWHVVTRLVHSDARLDRVLLSSTGKFGRVVDELRIGPTWRSVAPMLEETK